MLKPFEIDLLQQDLKAALNVVERDEIDDARALILEHGFLSDEFSINQLPNLSPAAKLSLITGTVTVTRKSTGRTRTYDAGSTSTWLADLETDLQAGVFDETL